MRTVLLLSLTLTSCWSAELPEMYRRVDRLLWVVGDVNRTVDGWKTLGVSKGDATVRDEAQAVTWRGRSEKSMIRYVGEDFGDIEAVFVQPLSGSNAFADFRKRRGAGVLGVLHRPPSRAAMETEIARLSAAGVGVLQRGRIGSAEYVLFDTEPEG